MKSYIQSSKTLTVRSESSSATVAMLPLGTSLPTQYGTGPRFVVDVAGTLASHAKLPFTSLFNFPADFTIEFWVKRGNWASSYSRLLDRSFSGGFSINRNNSAETITLSVNGNQFNSSVSLFAVWTHIAIVRIGTAGYIYMDGVLVGTGTAGGSAVSNSADIFIGVNGTTNVGNEGMPLRMGDIRIWNIGRSQPQIADNMREVLDYGASNLVGYWPMFKGDTKDFSVNECPPLTAVGTATIVLDEDFLEVFE